MKDRPTGACAQGKHGLCHMRGWTGRERFTCTCPCHAIREQHARDEASVDVQGEVTE